ncbi:MAG: hypothetical protein JWP12_2644 [Bacteroidetes bacterium]|nr:hypothetical protein [Bacteroidota bacterium]
MKTIFILSTILLSFSAAYSQTEPLNQLDSAGKKDGKWILYLDYKGDKLKDSVDAAYWRYTYYDNGVHIYPMEGFISENGKIESTGNSKQTSKIKILDGEYKCFDSEGHLRFIHVFKNGEYISYKEFYKSGALQEYFDYTKHYEGQPHSWYIYTYDKTGEVTYEGWTKKDANGHWPPMRG